MGSPNSFEATPEMVRFLCERLLDSTQPISERFRALFSLRNLRGKQPRDALIMATRDSSNLLAHEAAFALGQMQDAEAIPALESILNDLSLHPIVRHEAAEALGAIGLDTNIPILEKSLRSDPAPEVRETCELALQKIEDLKDGVADGKEVSPFLSVDPATPASHYFVAELRKRPCMKDMLPCLHLGTTGEMKLFLLLLIRWVQTVPFCGMRLLMSWANYKTKLHQLRL
ncbi:hypothetical protein Dimus_015535 [Dionaea muscipula]